ncbi:MAG: hypothetical protein PVF54_07960, partial [Anaerolineae bacterium]
MADGSGAAGLVVEEREPGSGLAYLWEEGPRRPGKTSVRLAAAAGVTLTTGGRADRPSLRASQTVP